MLKYKRFFKITLLKTMSQKEPSLKGHFSFFIISLFFQKNNFIRIFFSFSERIFLDIDWRCILMSKSNKKNNKDNKNNQSQNEERQNNNNNQCR